MDEEPVTLTEDQQKALSIVLAGERNVFITGAAGSGKSTLIRAIVKTSQMYGKNVLVCAPTGIAAMNLEGGMTIHAAFGFPAESCVRDRGKKGLNLLVSAQSLVKMADILLVDEISMVTPDLADSIILSLRKAERLTSRKKTLVIVGDFLQLAPVLPKNEPNRTLLETFYGTVHENWYAFMGRYWDECDFYPIFLKGSIRQKDQEFLQCLEKVRKGDSSCLEYLNMAVQHKADANAISLYALNSQVSEKNLKYLDSLPGTLFTYQTVVNLESNRGDVEMASCIPKELSIKKGAQILFTATDYNGTCSSRISKQGKKYAKEGVRKPNFMNGMTGIIEDISDNEIIVYTEQKEFIRISPMTRPINKLDIVSDHYINAKVGSYTQYPFTLAYAQTIHKAQGQTLTHVNVDPTTFAPGQLYVALSRVKSMDGLSLTRSIEPKDLKVDPVALAFYEKIEKVTGISGKRGRPAINTDGSKRTKMIWVPNTMVQYVRNSLKENRILPLPLKMEYVSGRTHMRITEELFEEMKSTIDKWKNDIK